MHPLHRVGLSLDLVPSHTGQDSHLEVAGSCGDNSAELVSLTTMRLPASVSKANN